MEHIDISQDVFKMVSAACKLNLPAELVHLQPGGHRLSACNYGMSLLESCYCLVENGCLQPAHSLDCRRTCLLALPAC